MRGFKISILLLTVLFFNTNVKSQTDSTSFSNQLQFHFVNGFSLSYLNYLNAHNAIRIKADVRLDYEKNDNDVVFKNVQLNDEQNNEEERDSDGQYLGVSIQYSHLWKLTDKIYFICGLGPTISFERSSYKTASTNFNFNPASKNEYNDKSRQWLLGVIASTAIQCDIYENISLLAEYDFRFAYGWNYSESSSEYSSISDASKSITTRDGNSWNLNLSSIKLGIGFRF